MTETLDQTRAGSTEAQQPSDEKASEQKPSQSQLPQNALIILPVRQAVLFPGMVLPLAIGRPPSVAAAQEAVRTERPLGIILQTDPASTIRSRSSFTR